MSKTTLGATMFALALFALSPAKGADNRPCKEDAQKLCKDEKVGQGLVRCLKAHEAELSQGCKDHLAKVKEKVGEVHEACQADAAKLCKDEKPGAGRVLGCLRAHKGELSDACKAAMDRPAR